MAQLDLNAVQQNAFPRGNFGGNATLGDIINAVLPWVFGFAGIALLIYLVLGGLQLMTSRGDPKAIQAAQSKITSALIGFIIILVSYFVVQLLGQLLGIGQFGLIFR